ncbi:MAG: DUF6265 family protein [Pseudomonadota bacterium]
MIRLHCMIALAGLNIATPAAAQEADLSWLAGNWCTERHPVKSTMTCEEWEPMAGGVMRGRTVVWHERFFTAEPMRITVEPTRLVFHAEPAKQAPADFYATGVEGQTVRFENRAHDYPQVVRYWREGDVLNAEISLADGSKPNRWVYRRTAK